MSTSCCGKICKTPPKRIRNETIILAVVLLLPLELRPGDAVFFVKVKVLCLGFQKRTQLEISG